MRTLFRILAIAGLVVVILLPILSYGVTKDDEGMKLWMLIGTVVWFVFSYLGFRQNPQQRELEDEHTPVA